MTASPPLLAGEALIALLAEAGGAGDAAGSPLPLVTLGLAEAAEVQGRVLGLIGSDPRWLVLVDGVELHHVRLDQISRISLSAESLRQVQAAKAAAGVPSRLGLVRRAAAIAAAVQAELAAPFAIDLAFDHFPEDAASLRAIDGALDELAEALRQQTASPLGIERLSVHIRGVQIALADPDHPAGLTRAGDRLVLRLPVAGRTAGRPGGDLPQHLQAVLS
ncbi:hypothetical protein [Zavarzinia compransoris]|uniref:Uncharacterized protein n=1 Tax=Zavarzinia compransoris TaxID=1264899 RepID=A0A317E7W0_9PROT|nr:hypothetical protein [Zavarzinia compransoris]PWR23029.1 hypothetical protein DKG75_00160 [Zavarzinia compransoris]TDP46426.1 hypothetical protein DES42_104515 [Zavarzinia compransoris]